MSEWISSFVFSCLQKYQNAWNSFFICQRSCDHHGNNYNQSRWNYWNSCCCLRIGRRSCENLVGWRYLLIFFYVKTLYIFNSYFNWIVFSLIWNQGRALNCQIVHSDPVRQIKLLSNQRTISRSAFDGKILVMWKLRDGQVLDSFSFENKNSTCTSMDVGKNDMVAIGKKHDQLTRNTSWILCNFTQFLLQK